MKTSNFSYQILVFVIGSCMGMLSFECVYGSTEVPATAELTPNLEVGVAKDYTRELADEDTFFMPVDIAFKGTAYTPSGKELGVSVEEDPSFISSTCGLGLFRGNRKYVEWMFAKYQTSRQSLYNIRIGTVNSMFARGLLSAIKDDAPFEKDEQAYEDQRVSPGKITLVSYGPVSLESELELSDLIEVRPAHLIPDLEAFPEADYMLSFRLSLPGGYGKQLQYEALMIYYSKGEIIGTEVRFITTSKSNADKIKISDFIGLDEVPTRINVGEEQAYYTHSRCLNK